MDCSESTGGSIEGARVRLTLDQPEYVVSVTRWMGKVRDVRACTSILSDACSPGIGYWAI